MAFIEMTKDYEGSRKVYYKSDKDCSEASGVNLCKDCLTVPVVGETAWKAGYATYLTKGKILSTKYTSNIDTDGDDKTDIVLKNMLLTSCIAGKGDSGGILFDKNEGNDVLGIQSAVVKSSKVGNQNKYTESVFSSADYITDINWGRNGIWMY